MVINSNIIFSQSSIPVNVVTPKVLPFIKYSFISFMLMLYFLLQLYFLAGDGLRSGTGPPLPSAFIDISIPFGAVSPHRALDTLVVIGKFIVVICLRELQLSFLQAFLSLFLFFFFPYYLIFFYI